MYAILSTRACNSIRTFKGWEDDGWTIAREYYGRPMYMEKKDGNVFYVLMFKPEPEAVNESS